MSEINDLIKELEHCPVGQAGWSQFEDICIRILKYLFVPPLSNPLIQARTYSGVNRRDAIFPNRNFSSSNNWSLLYNELNARMILFEFKNYDSIEIGHEEVNQTSSYMTTPMGRLAFMVCSKVPNDSAHRQRNTLFSQPEKKVILFLTKEELKEMLIIKERGEDPSDLIIDLLERFYVQHE